MAKSESREAAMVMTVVGCIGLVALVLVVWALATWEWFRVGVFGLLVCAWVWWLAAKVAGRR